MMSRTRGALNIMPTLDERRRLVETLRDAADAGDSIAVLGLLLLGAQATALRQGKKSGATGHDRSRG